MSARALTLKAALLLGLALPTASAMAQNADNLFAKKTVTIFIGNTAGGSYDLSGRMVARFLGKHLPGQPTVVASNMPGAGATRGERDSSNRTATLGKGDFCPPVA